MANENDESETIREIVWLPIEYMQVFATFRSETDSEGLGAQKAQSFARMVAFGEPEGFFFSLCVIYPPVFLWWTLLVLPRVLKRKMETLCVERNFVGVKRIKNLSCPIA